MTKRRPLTAGIKPSTDQKRESTFVYGKKGKGRGPEGGEPTNQSAGRSPLSTRIRADLATALKRASLERQLAGVVPNTVQDIIEGVLEPWLRDQGYLP